MNDLNNSSESAVKHIDSALKHLMRRWTSVKKARKDLDFRTGAQALDGIDQDIRHLETSWSEHQSVIKETIQLERDFVLSDAYPPEVEKAMHDAEVPIRGEFPNYEFPPFKLTFSHSNGYVKLSMGRRSIQTKTFAPSALAAWVSQEYQKIVNSKFNAEHFCQELLVAYEMLNQLNLKRDSVLWGHPVTLKEIYKILTLKQSVKQDYPEVLFAYDLARLKEQFEISYDSRRFELAPSRNQSSGLLLVNSKGQESRVSSLIIYDKTMDKPEAELHEN